MSPVVVANCGTFCYLVFYLAITLVLILWASPTARALACMKTHLDPILSDAHPVSVIHQIGEVKTQILTELNSC